MENLDVNMGDVQNNPAQEGAHAENQNPPGHPAPEAGIPAGQPADGAAEEVEMEVAPEEKEYSGKMLTLDPKYDGSTPVTDSLSDFELLMRGNRVHHRV
jgi:hypothetical protein